jgi:AcrR family transcriptional regulator
MGKAHTVKIERRGRPPVQGLIERRRREILDVAARIFAERGYAKSDLQIVADELGLGKGTLYRYFPTKRDLFLAAADRSMARLSEHIHSVVDKIADPLERIKVAIRSYLEFFDEHPEYIELIIQERAEFKDRKKPTYFAHRDANIGPWRELVRGLIKSGRIRNVPVDRVTDVMNYALYGTIFTNHFAGRKQTLERQTRDVLDILLNGMLSKSER